MEECGVGSSWRIKAVLIPDGMREAESLALIKGGPRREYELYEANCGSS